jgi:ABC-type polysaccharide/polyol phosphate transport system ATPase subunit
MAESESYAVRDQARPGPTAAPPEAGVGSGAAPATVAVRGLGKRFRVPQEQMSTLKERVMNPLGRARARELVALRDVNFEVNAGEFFSIVGRNGSGKSTLLKCLAGVYRPDAGEVRVRGRLSPFIELGVGFNPNLNALDNVLLNATLIGLTPREARRRFPAIIEFAELEEFVDMKLKNFSTGMQMRLGFATAIQVDADVLLVDEVLAVGDAPFRRKCLDTFHRLKEEGRTIVFVSHDTGVIRQLSDRVLVVEGGEVVTIGRSQEALGEYEVINARYETERRELGPGGQLGDGSAEIIDAWFETEGGERASGMQRGERACFKLSVAFHRAMESPVLGFSLLNEQGGLVLTVHSRMEGIDTGSVGAGERRTFVARYPNWLGGGVYFASPFVLHEDGRWAAVIERALMLEVASDIPGNDAVIPPSEIEVLGQ